jgi:hypothetical protein
MVKNFKKGFNGNYGVKLTSNKLRALYEVDWPAVGVGWSPEGSPTGQTVFHTIYFTVMYCHTLSLSVTVLHHRFDRNYPS